MKQIIPYPVGDDPTLEPDNQADSIRKDLRVSDVLAILQDLLLEITDDDKHPLLPIVQYAVTYGTSMDTGKRSHLLELVGDRLDPYVQVAIDLCVTTRLFEEEM